MFFGFVLFCSFKMQELQEFQHFWVDTIVIKVYYRLGIIRTNFL